MYDLGHRVRRVPLRSAPVVVFLQREDIEAQLALLAGPPAPLAVSPRRDSNPRWAKVSRLTGRRWFHRAPARIQCSACKAPASDMTMVGRDGSRATGVLAQVIGLDARPQFT